MNLKSKVHVEKQKLAAETELAARVANLRKKDVDDRAIERNPTVRRLQGAIRQALGRLDRIAAIEKENVDRVQAKADRAAAKEKSKAKGPAEKPQEAAAAKKPKKEKKEKKAKPVAQATAAAEAPAPAAEAPAAKADAPAAEPASKD